MGILLKSDQCPRGVWQPSSHLGRVNYSANILIFALSVYPPTLMTGQTGWRYQHSRSVWSAATRSPAASDANKSSDFPRFPGVPWRPIPRATLINYVHAFTINQTMPAKCIYYCLNTLRTTTPIRFAFHGVTLMNLLRTISLFYIHKIIMLFVIIKIVFFILYYLLLI